MLLIDMNLTGSVASQALLGRMDDLIIHAKRFRGLTTLARDLRCRVLQHQRCFHLHLSGVCNAQSYYRQNHSSERLNTRASDTKCGRDAIFLQLVMKLARSEARLLVHVVSQTSLPQRLARLS